MDETTLQEGPVEETPPPETTGRPQESIELIPAPLPPLRPPPQRPQSTLEIGSSATLPLRPLSSNIDMTTGDLIYDKLPETLPRPPKSHPSTVTATPITEGPTEEERRAVKMAEAEESAQIEEESVVVKKKEFKEVPDDQGKKDNLPSDNRACTIVTMVLCGLILNVFAFFCLIPAYCYSLKSKEKSLANETDEGVKLAKRSLILNIIAVVCTFLGLLIIFILLQIIFGATIYQNP